MDVLQLGSTTTVAATNVETIATTSVDNVLPKPVARVQEEDDDDTMKEGSPSNTASPATSSSLRKCKFCSQMETESNKFLVCGPCKKVNVAVPYCSKACQANDWPRHKTVHFDRDHAL